MPLIKAGRLVDDQFLEVADGAPLPAQGAVIISLPRWQEERGLIEQRMDPLGLRLKPSEPVEQIAPDLHRFAVVALEFPKFNDGRAFSQARLLRERYGYKGEIRAIGRVVGDLLLFMHRCGFDAFATEGGMTGEIAQRNLNRLTLSYQPAADRRPSVIELRHGLRRKEVTAAGEDRCAGGCVS